MRFVHQAYQGFCSEIGILLIASSLCFLGACNFDSNDDPDLPKILRIGVLPDDSEVDVRKRHTLLFDYLAEELDLTCKFIIPEDYTDLLAQFSEGKIDLAYFGGFTFILAEGETGAVPVAIRDIDTRFTSYLITGPEDSGKPFDYFEGKILSFGPKISTSGHLMPRHFITEKVGTVEKYFSSVRYTESHDRTVYEVRDGKADMAAVNSEILDRMIKDVRIKPGEINIWGETPGFPDYVWAAHPGLGKKAIAKLRDAFLSLSPSDVNHAKILAAGGAGGYLPAAASDFAPLFKIASLYGLIESDQ